MLNEAERLMPAISNYASSAMTTSLLAVVGSVPGAVSPPGKLAIQAVCTDLVIHQLSTWPLHFSTHACIHARRQPPNIGPRASRRPGAIPLPHSHPPPGINLTDLSPTTLLSLRRNCTCATTVTLSQNRHAVPTGRAWTCNTPWPPWPRQRPLATSVVSLCCHAPAAVYAH